ncbi:hypothetical protein LXL04_039326 [Taraxacum kok-saghyz]
MAKFWVVTSCSSGSKLLHHSPFPSNLPNSLIFVSSSSKFAAIPQLQFCLRSPVSRSSSLDSSPLNQLSPVSVDQRVSGLPHAIRLRIKMSQLCILASLNHCTSILQMGTRLFEDIRSHRTKLLVYNLWLNDEGIYKLDFDGDDEAYVSMLYLRKLKNFKIFLRGEPIMQFNIADELKCTEVVTYSPQVSSMKAAIVETTLGFIKVAPALPITGFNIYHKNCLIRVFLCEYIFLTMRVSLDVLFHFNTQALLEDNIVGQLFRIGWKMVMFGDETWLKLFLGLFTHDRISSFLVKDTAKVDHNVSRHLSYELFKSDWNLLILHYLGLDHVGHLGGRIRYYLF